MIWVNNQSIYTFQAHLAYEDPYDARMATEPAGLHFGKLAGFGLLEKPSISLYPPGMAFIGGGLDPGPAPTIFMKAVSGGIFIMYW